MFHAHGCHVQHPAGPELDVLRRRHASHLKEDSPNGGEHVDDRLKRPTLELPFIRVRDYGDRPEPLSLGEALGLITHLESPDLPSNVSRNLYEFRPSTFEEAYPLLICLSVGAVLQKVYSVEQIYWCMLVAWHKDDGLVVRAASILLPTPDGVGACYDSASHLTQPLVRASCAIRPERS